MASSFLSRLAASIAYSATSSFVNLPLYHTDSAWMVMRAVVNVPVLSEHSTDMEEMSWRAGKDVTTAWKSRAILPAPKAIVTWSTSGRATGMEAMRMDRHVSTKVLISCTLNCLRAMPCTNKMMITSTMVTPMMILTAYSTRISNTEIFSLVLSCMISAWDEPTSVLMPVLRTTQYASPALIVAPHRINDPYSSEGYLRGNGSPVKAAVSTDKISPSIQSTSAGTWHPPSSKITSPGTSKRVNRCSALPSRTTAIFCSMLFVNSSNDFFAFNSSMKPKYALQMTMAAIIAKSIQSWHANASTQQISSTLGMRPVNCRARRTTGGPSEPGT